MSDEIKNSRKTEGGLEVPAPERFGWLSSRDGILANVCRRLAGMTFTMGGLGGLLNEVRDLVIGGDGGDPDDDPADLARKLDAVESVLDDLLCAHRDLGVGPHRDSNPRWSDADALEAAIRRCKERGSSPDDLGRHLRETIARMLPIVKRLGEVAWPLHAHLQALTDRTDPNAGTGYAFVLVRRCEAIPQPAGDVIRAAFELAETLESCFVALLLADALGGAERQEPLGAKSDQRTLASATEAAR